MHSVGMDSIYKCRSPSEALELAHVDVVVDVVGVAQLYKQRPERLEYYIAQVAEIECTRRSKERVVFALSRIMRSSLHSILND